MTASRFAACLGALALAGVSIIPAGSAAAAPKASAEGKAALASAWPAIKAANADWFPAVQAGDAERLAEPYGETAVFIAPDGSAYTGHAAIVALYKARAATRRKLTAGAIVHDGMAYGGKGLVFEWGHGELSSLDEAGKPVKGGGAYLTAWRRDAEGHWKIVRNIAF